MDRESSQSDGRRAVPVVAGDALVGGQGAHAILQAAPSGGRWRPGRDNGGRIDQPLGVITFGRDEPVLTRNSARIERLPGLEVETY